MIGPIHGLAFLAYGWTAFETVIAGGWSRRETARLFLLALMPFGGFVNVAFLRRKVAAA